MTDQPIPEAQPPLTFVIADPLLCDPTGAPYPPEAAITLKSAPLAAVMGEYARGIVRDASARLTEELHRHAQAWIDYAYRLGFSDGASGLSKSTIASETARQLASRDVLAIVDALDRQTGAILAPRVTITQPERDDTGLISRVVARSAAEGPEPDTGGAP